MCLQTALTRSSGHCALHYWCILRCILFGCVPGNPQLQTAPGDLSSVDHWALKVKSRCLTSFARTAPLRPLGLDPGTYRMLSECPTNKLICLCRSKSKFPFCVYELLRNQCACELRPSTRSSNRAPIAVLAPPHSSISAEPMTSVVRVVVPITVESQIEVIDVICPHCSFAPVGT